MDLIKRNPGHCMACDGLAMTQFLIYEQLGGEFKTMYVCNRCRMEHEKRLEMTRENFRRQFGEN